MLLMMICQLAGTIFTVWLFQRFINREAFTSIGLEFSGYKDDFISGLKIKGDKNDEITLPENALQTNSDDLYLYYTLNDVEIGISIDLQLI